MKITRRANVSWSGGMKTGDGAISTQSGALDRHPYGYGSRFEQLSGTNPEELLAASHAGCFTMFLAYVLELEQLTPDLLETKAAITFEVSDSGFDITTSHLTLVAKIPGIDPARFNQLVAQAETGCAISKVMRAKISVEATLLPA
ncbi:OsmC family peroxiredoxin [Duganella aceris]|uniref:OsmC family peroxiredoxin n=1 Tax=Duganella aceris TaxID=2703883 RepID=A0ABX0FFQ8_9BURK|nr:OsmC family peroxiredoxin [Duganella aceris]NGZ83358.1 OsmC family peroxiredoxin [Duganella aceris]